MEIDQKEIPRIQKYLDEGSAIHTLIHLQAANNRKRREMLAITSSSLVKYNRFKNHEEISVVFLRHITGVRLTVDGLKLGRLIAGIILLALGSILSIVAMIPTQSYDIYYHYYFTFYSNMYLIYFGLPPLILGVILLITAFTGRGGTLRIHSYDTEEPIVDIRFAIPMLGVITKVSKDLQRILSLGERGTPTAQMVVKPVSQQLAQHPAQSMPSQGGNTEGPIPLASGGSSPYATSPSIKTPEAEYHTLSKPVAVAEGVKRCMACGALIPNTQEYCQDCGSKQ